MKLYSLICSFYVSDFKFDNAKTYLDSALFYENQVENKNILGVLHYSAGQLYNMTAETKLAHQHYYKALEYFDKNQTKTSLSVEILYALASFYVVQNDILNLKQIIQKMEKYSSGVEDLYGEILTCSVKSQYYEMLYNKTNINNYLDSMKYSDLQAINKYHHFADKSTGESYQIAYIYMNMAKNYLRDSIQSDSVLFYVNHALKFANPNDLNLQARCRAVLGYYFKNKNDLNRAKKEFELQLGLLRESPSYEFFEMISTCNALAEIYEKLGNLQKAVEYLKLKSEYGEKLHDQNMNETIQKLQVQFDVAKKEQAIQQLSEEAQYQRKIKHMYIGIFILIVIILLFVIHRYRMKRRKDADMLYIRQMEKEEAQMQAQLREEQANNAELKKYEALMDLQLKDLEIEGKETELESLKQEKEKLDNQLIIYNDIINKFKTIELNKNNDTLISPIKNDLKKTLEQITLTNGISRTYIDKINRINDFFLTKLEEQSQEKLSFLSVKYCIAFAIDLETEDIAACFDIEPKSVRQIRYRLKQKFRLGRDTELDLFFKTLINLSST